MHEISLNWFHCLHKNIFFQCKMILGFLRILHVVFYVDKKKREIKIDPNNIFIYIFIFVKFSFNYSLNRQAKQLQQAVKVKSFLVHWTSMIGSTLGRIIRFEMADGFSALHVKDTIYIEQIMFDISTLAPNSLPTYRKSSWHRSLKIYTQLLNIFSPCVLSHERCICMCILICRTPKLVYCQFFLFSRNLPTR